MTCRRYRYTPASAEDAETYEQPIDVISLILPDIGRHFAPEHDLSHSSYFLGKGASSPNHPNTMDRGRPSGLRQACHPSQSPGQTSQITNNQQTLSNPIQPPGYLFVSIQLGWQRGCLDEPVPDPAQKNDY